MRALTIKRLIIFTFICGVVLFISYRFLKPALIPPKGRGDDPPIDTIFLASHKYQDNFIQSSERAELFAKTFRKAGQLMEDGKYDLALDLLNESLQKADRKFQKRMAFDRMQVIYKQLGNLEKELEAIESWFAQADENASNPVFERRAAEIREIMDKPDAV